MEYKLSLLTALVTALLGVIGYFWVGPLGELRAGPTVVIDTSMRDEDLVIRVENPSRTPVAMREFTIHCGGEICFQTMTGGQWVAREIGKYTVINRDDTSDRQISLIATIPAEEYLQIALRKVEGAPLPAVSFTPDASGSTPQQLSSQSISGLLLLHYAAVITFAALAAVLALAALGVMVLWRPSLPADSPALSASTTTVAVSPPPGSNPAPPVAATTAAATTVTTTASLPTPTVPASVTSDITIPPVRPNARGDEA